VIEIPTSIPAITAKIPVTSTSISIPFIFFAFTKLEKPFSNRSVFGSASLLLL
jgi:hypothetical protein